MLEVVGRIARNGHLTVPVKIRRLLHLKEGDVVRICVQRNQIVITPGAFIDKDQAYVFTDACQRKIKKSEKEFEKGKYSSYTSVEDFKKEIEID